MSGQEHEAFESKPPIFERLGSHSKDPGFLLVFFFVWFFVVDFFFFSAKTQSSSAFPPVPAIPSQDPAGNLPGAAFRARKVPTAGASAFSYCTARTSGGEPREGEAAFETHRLDPDKMKRRK